jgi:uncharacterized integral membrane protein (TIGR00697 family)
MTFALIATWIVGVSSFTLLGSLYARRYDRIDLLVGLYVAFVLVAQILESKVAIFDFGYGSFSASAGILVYSVTFLMTDIVSERFGRKETQRMIFIAVVAQVAMLFFLWLGSQFQADPSYGERGSHWDALFVFVPRVVFASLLSFFVAENVDVYIYIWFKKLTKGKYLWMRNVISTLPSLALDSLIFIPIAFYGNSAEMIVSAIGAQILLKWSVGLVNVPFLYANYAILLDRRETPDRVVFQIPTAKE